jgi:hypothetical protein
MRCQAQWSGNASAHPYVPAVRATQGRLLKHFCRSAIAGHYLATVENRHVLLRQSPAHELLYIDPLCTLVAWAAATFPLRVLIPIPLSGRAAASSWSRSLTPLPLLVNLPMLAHAYHLGCFGRW